MMKWISVKEKLPINNDVVLVFNHYDGISTGEYDSEKVRSYIEKDGSLFYTDTGWETNYSWAQRIGPTHWMPLPKTPEDECDCDICRFTKSILTKETCCTGCSKLPKNDKSFDASTDSLEQDQNLNYGPPIRSYDVKLKVISIKQTKETLSDVEE